MNNSTALRYFYRNSNSVTARTKVFIGGIIAGVIASSIFFGLILMTMKLDALLASMN